MDLVQGLDKVCLVGVGEESTGVEERFDNILEEEEAETHACEAQEVGTDDEGQVQSGVLNPKNKEMIKILKLESRNKNEHTNSNKMCTMNKFN